MLASLLQSRSAQSADGKGRFSADALCFPEQLAGIRSPAKRKCFRLPRRTGKTTGIAGIGLLENAIVAPYANQLYATLSLKNARRLVWPVLKRLNIEHKLGGVANESEAYLRFPDLPNEPHIFLGGMKDAAEIDKLRGYEGGLKHVIIDEAQSIRQGILAEAIDDIIEPSLFDYDGSLTIIGTPGPVAAGYFYDCDVGKLRGAWEHFFWTMHANPWLAIKSKKPTDQMIRELLAKRGWTEDHPTFRRQYLGEWVNDPDALVFKWLAERNGIDAAPARDAGKWSFVIGVDLGFDDSDAIAVLGWRPHDPTVYLFEEHVMAKAGMTALMDALKSRVATYRPISIVMDLGGLAKKAVEDFRARFTLPLQAADKARKLDHVEMLNDALLGGRFKAPKTSRFAQDCMLVQWDDDKLALGERKIAREPHSDITDAVLYGYTECLAWLARPAPPPDSEVSHVTKLFREQQRQRGRDPYARLLGIDD